MTRTVCWFSAPYSGDRLNLDRAEVGAELFQAAHPELLVVCPWTLWARAGAHGHDAEAVDDCCDFIRERCDALATTARGRRYMSDGMLREFEAAEAAGLVVYLNAGEE
jgi:hypothetical protein